MTQSTHLTKSRYLAGLQCSKRLWLQCHERHLATPPKAGLKAIFEAGDEVGVCAHQLFPGGVLIEEKYDEHTKAMAHTQELMDDPSIPALFEAAFEHREVRIRVDILERLADGAWGLREVKSASGVKASNLEDVAVQLLVLRGCGLDVRSAELIHIDKNYERGEGDIDWSRFFHREDLTASADACLAAVSDGIREMHAVVGSSQIPNVQPWSHCKKPHSCEFWEHCTRDKPRDWVLRLPGRSQDQTRMLAETGPERIGELPPDFARNELQERAMRACATDRIVTSSELGAALKRAGPPSLYLDFETIGPALPIYPNTNPYQILAVQWSLHELDIDGKLSHREFLAEGDVDPRRAVAEALIAAAGFQGTPIIVYSSYEKGILNRMADRFDDLSADLHALAERLVDLLPIVRSHVYHPGFEGSFSIKSVAPVMAPDLTYDDLDQISEGLAAATAFERIARGELSPQEEAATRQRLRQYCTRDTRALVEVHRALLALES